jgi:hypothetical protein
MKAVLFVAILALSPVACRKHTMSVSLAHHPANTLVAGSFIDAAGTFTYTDGALTHEIELSPGPSAVSCELRYREQRPGVSRSSSGSHPIRLSDPGDRWFVFVESPGRLWFYNGRDHLDYECQTPGGRQSGLAIASGQLVPNTPPIPAELAPRLPEELRSLLPAAVPPGTRPSF